MFVCVDILFIYRVFVKCLVSLPMFCPHLDMVWNVTTWHRPPSVLYVTFCVFSYSLIICYPCGGAALNSNPNNCLLLFDCMIFRGLCYFFYALCKRRKCLQIFLYFAFMHERKLPWKIKKKLTFRFEYFIFVLLFAHEFSLLILETVSSCWICLNLWTKVNASEFS